MLTKLGINHIFAEIESPSFYQVSAEPEYYIYSNIHERIEFLTLGGHVHQTLVLILIELEKETKNESFARTN